MINLSGIKNRYYICFMLFFGLTVSTIAGGRPTPSGSVNDNIALDKPYTLSPNPNYSLCTDDDDLIQLTDGYNYTVSGSTQLWGKITTVGWIAAYPEITIDLGVVQPIKGIDFYTAASNGSGVYWPTSIELEISNDNINYYSIGDLVSLSSQENGNPPSAANGHVFHCFQTTTLATHGRYVRIKPVRQSGTSFIFVDEIKVIRGNDSLLENIALSKTYSLSPSPNYSLCTDSGDTTQLTDGTYYTGTSMPWIMPSYTVGWMWLNPQWAEIKVDLGSDQPIDGASFSSPNGTEANGVSGPISITVLVSDDDSTYYKAGEITSLSTEHGVPNPFNASNHSYWTDRLATHGRYVKFVPSLAGTFLFTDEIEIYKGHSGMLDQSRGSAVTDLADIVKKDQIRGGTARRIALDIQSVQAQTDNDTSLSDEDRQEIESMLIESSDEIISLSDSNPSTFSTEMPINSSHTRVFSALQKLWNAQGKSGLIAWLTAPLDPLSPTQEIGTTSASNGIDITMMQGEYRTVSFNLSNTSSSDMSVSLNITGLPSSTNPSYIKVKEIAWTDTLSGFPVAVAMPDASTDANGYVINIPTGMTRQVCLTFNPTSSSPGKYGTFTGSVTADSVTIPLNFRLSRLNFPENPTLSMGGWDYTDRDSYCGMTSTNRSALISLLEENFVDTTWGTSAVMPNPASFTDFDIWYNRWSKAENYRIFLNVGTSFNGYQMGTTNFNNAVATWINAYADHWENDLGLNLSQIGLLLVDEPNDSNEANIIINWANAISAAQPDIIIWEDPAFPDPQNWSSLFSVTDVLCPHRPSFIAGSETYKNAFRNSGKTLNFYSCKTGGRLLDPYSYYRLQAWTCWDESATGTFFWSFAFTGYASSWNEYNARSYNSTLVFLDPDSSTVVTGKQMEAAREGIEDYEYLNMLKNSITALTGSNHSSLSAAQTLLDGAGSAVLDAADADERYWSTSKDRELADNKRIEVLDMLEKLNNIANGTTYTLSPTPEYPYCTDSGDTTQLTDGYVYAGTGSLWTQTSTVGWRGVTPVITIDLGSVQQINGASFTTAASPSAQAYWPTAINIAVSNDNISYTNAGDLVSLSNSENGVPPTSGKYRYETRGLNTSGRYVKITVTRNGTFVFCDEIEIMND
jgi:F5/8 type C domain